VSGPFRYTWTASSRAVAVGPDLAWAVSLLGAPSGGPPSVG